MTNIVEFNNGNGVIEFRDINQNIIIENLSKNLDSLNKEWMTNNKKNENSIINNLLSKKEKILDISRHNLFFKNTFFKNEKVYFEDIYVPLDIQIDKHVRSLTDNKPISESFYTIDNSFLVEKIIKNNNIINIIGGAGQGKSTVLSKIFINQLRMGSLIPIFLSFRNIEKNITHKITQIFEDNGISCENGELVGLLRSKKFILIIDAFDEISDESLKITVINEINRMNNVYGLSIVCSSRPGTKLCFQSNVKNHDLCDLNIEQIDEIIDKTLKIKSYQSDKIINSLNKENGIKSSLKTPLLTVLFVKMYPEMDIVPEHARDFYDQIFSLLYSGHDKYKDGVEIHRNLVKKYNRDDTKLIFLLFCFTTFMNNQSSFVIETANKFLKGGIEYFKSKLSKQIVELNSLDFLNDIIDCTSMLVLDGVEKGEDYYTFLHKTIQEYHAALFFRDFIKQELGSNLVNKFTDKFIDELFNNSTKIIEFIKFYIVIDKNFSKKNILYPFLNKYFFDEKKNREENITHCMKVIFENYLRAANLTIQSKIQRTDKHQEIFTKDPLKYSYRNKDNSVLARDEGTFQLNIYSTLRETFINISYIYGIEEKVQYEFDTLIGAVTDFSSRDFYPINKKEIQKLERGEIVYRVIETTIEDLVKRREYLETYNRMEKKLRNLSELIFDAFYVPLQEDIAKMNEELTSIDSSIENLFSL